MIVIADIKHMPNKTHVIERNQCTVTNTYKSQMQTRTTKRAQTSKKDSKINS